MVKRNKKKRDREKVVGGRSRENRRRDAWKVAHCSAFV
jgi:hypothetical protein